MIHVHDRASLLTAQVWDLVHGTSPPTARSAGARSSTPTARRDGSRDALPRRVDDMARSTSDDVGDGKYRVLFELQHLLQSRSTEELESMARSLRTAAPH